MISNLRYNQLKENDPTQKDLEENYPTPGMVRNICFVQLNGNRIFLSYAFIVSVEYIEVEDKIVIVFTSHIISLSGVSLKSLFYDLMNHLPQFVICKDERYNQLGSKENYSVNEIEILPQK
jgi:hypothetical protein